LSRGLHRPAIAILLAFDCYLRATEFLFLRKEDVAFPGDPRLPSEQYGAIRLRFTKAGRPQWVSVRDSAVLMGLKFLCDRASPGSLLFGVRYAHMLEVFKRAQVWAGFEEPPFVLHCERHGGASHDFSIGKQMDFIMHRGRWAAMRTTRIYIQEARGRLLDLGMPAAVLQRLLEVGDLDFAVTSLIVRLQ
jgi:integrase